jgi:hypothetical protein
MEDYVEVWCGRGLGTFLRIVTAARMQVNVRPAVWIELGIREALLLARARAGVSEAASSRSSDAGAWSWIIEVRGGCSPKARQIRIVAAPLLVAHERS